MTTKIHEKRVISIRKRVTNPENGIKQRKQSINSIGATQMKIETCHIEVHENLLSERY